MPVRRDSSPLRGPSTALSRPAHFKLLALTIALGVLFACAHLALRPYYSRLGLSQPLPAAPTEAEIGAMQTPSSENDLATDWNVPKESLQRLARATDDLQGVDAELDRRWRGIIADLPPERRFELLQALLVASGERPATPRNRGSDDRSPTEADDDSAAPATLSVETLESLRASWEKELADLSGLFANSATGEATEEGRRLVSSVRAAVDQQFLALAEVGRPSNASGDTPPDSTTSHSAVLLPVLDAWDGAALSGVADATANGDQGDFGLWYRLFQRLAHVAPESLRDAARDGISEAALMQQSGAYRGELFTLVGTARGGKSVKAQPNVLGIRRYYVIWVQPDDDRDALIAVYSLSKPEGYPDLPEQSDLVRFAYRVEAPVYYLKKIAYESRDAISVSPLVLARSFRFEPPAPVVPSEPPSLMALAVAAGFVIVVGIFLLAFLYRRTRPGSGDAEPMPDRIDEKSIRTRFVE